MDEELLKKLCCPETHQTLRVAEAAMIAQLNAKVGRGELRNRAGGLLDEPLESGLVRSDGRWLYPLRAGIPVMLIDEAIALDV